MVLNQEKSKGGNFYGYSKPAGFTGKSFEVGDFNGIDSSKIGVSGKLDERDPS
jgi:hypothetical protein